MTRLDDAIAEKKEALARLRALDPTGRLESPEIDEALAAWRAARARVADELCRGAP